jgi:hypothetical protein
MPNQTVQLDDVRISYAHNIFVAKAPTTDPTATPKYNGTFLLEPGSLAEKKINNAIVKVAKEKWPDDWEKNLKALKAQDKLCIHDGDTRPDSEGYEGMKFVSANSKIRPTTIDQKRNPVTMEDGVIFSGCYVNARLDIWAMDHPSYGKRICAEIKGVQKLRDGEALGAVVTPAKPDDFDDVSDIGEENEDTTDEADSLLGGF